MDIKTALQHMKFGLLVPPQLKDNGDLAGNTYFDCDGMAAVLVLGMAGTTDANLGSTDEASPLILEECDTSGGSYDEIAESELDAVIAGDTDDNKLVGWFVDRAKTRKRYLRIKAPHAADGTNGATFAAIAIGIPEGNLPKTASECGLKEFVCL